MGLAFWRSKKRAANAGGKPASRSSTVPRRRRRSAARSRRGFARARASSADRRLGAAAGRRHHRADAARSRAASRSRRTFRSTSRASGRPSRRACRLPPVPAAEAPGRRRPTRRLRRTRRRRSPRRRQGRGAERREARGRHGAGRARAPLRSPRPKRTTGKPRKGRGGPPGCRCPAACRSKGGKFAVQAAAPASEKSAREMVDRLKKGGFATYTEKVETKDGTRYRVRVGPYATRDDAEKARARLKSQGVSGNLVAL